MRVGLRQSLARLAAARSAIDTLQPAVDRLVRALDGARKQVAAGLVPPGALAQASEVLYQARYELVDAQLQHAQAIADLCQQTAAIALPGQTSQMLAMTLRRTTGWPN